MVSTTPGRQAELQTSVVHDSSAGSGRLAEFRGEQLPDVPHAPRTLPEALSHAARVGPEDAIVYHRAEGRGEVQSYAMLLARARQVQAGLRASGLSPGDVVLMQLPEVQDVIETFWGCVLGGFLPLILPVPPSYIESNGALDKLLAIHEFLDGPLLVTGQSTIDVVSAALSHHRTGVLAVALESLRLSAPAASPHTARPDDPVLLNLSSGSTGRPKCITLSHHNLLSRARGTNWLCDHRPDDRALNWLPFDHIGSISDWHIRCITVPCRAVYTLTADILARPLEWLDLLARYRITHSWAPNFAYALVRDAALARTDRPWDLRCVKSLLTAGESVTSEVVHGFLEALAPCGLSRAAMRPAFGMAELGSGVTYATPDEQQAIKTHTIDSAAIGEPVNRIGADDPEGKTFADLGPVIPGVSMRIVDANDHVVPEDTVGRLQIKGSAVFSGYFKDPDATAQAFTADGWFNTGDIGFIASGHLVVTGREKETIVINGANFHNHELEAVVERVAGVDISYTAACAVRHAGGASDTVAIFIHPVEDDEQSWPELLQEIRAVLVRRVGVNPQYIIPVRREDIPKTSIGKIQRSVLSRRFENGDFQPVLDSLQQLAASRRTANQAPVDERERTIVRVWQEVLGIDRIGSHDSFFDLGGQSLHLAQVRSKLLDEYQIDVTLITLLAHPTVSSLATHLGARHDDGATFQQSRDRSKSRKAAAGRRRARRLSARSATSAGRSGV